MQLVISNSKICNLFSEITVSKVHTNTHICDHTCNTHFARAMCAKCAISAKCAIKSHLYIVMFQFFWFFFVTSAKMWVQSCLTYQIKGDILGYLNISLNFLLNEHIKNNNYNIPYFKSSYPRVIIILNY